MHPYFSFDIQEEVDAAMEEMNENDNFPDYNIIQNMEYLDMVFHETLRLHPALGMLQRSAITDYQIPGKINIYYGIIDPRQALALKVDRYIWRW